MISLWDTTGSEVVKALAAERRNAGGVASGIALTLIAVADERTAREAEIAGATAAASHPCRLIIVVRGESPPAGAGPSPSHLDAEVVVGGRLGPCEGVVLRMRGRLVHHAESVVVPLLAPDVPVVTWWHGPPPAQIAYDPLGVVADRRITDAAQSPDPIAALRARAEDYAPGDTDLAWTRATPWRSVVTNALDGITDPVVESVVRAAPRDPTGALLGAWLHAKLGITPKAEKAGPLVQGVSLRLRSGEELVIERDEGVARLHRSGIPDRSVPLPMRQLGDQLAEELHHLDSDQVYAAALGALTNSGDLESRPPSRVMIWHDEDSPVTGGDVSQAEVHVSSDPEDLAHATAARLLTTVKRAQNEHGLACIVLTGGRIAERIYAAVRDNPARDSVDWSRVEIWWSDERLLPSGDPQRNETAARAELLSRIPIDNARVHPMPAASDGSTPESAAAAYAEALARSGGSAQLPHFDLAMVSIGEDGHIASVFPQHPSVHETGAVAGVHDSPKPPPERVTLTLPTLNTADEIWILGSGSAKADVVGRALAGGVDPVELPAAGLAGRTRTLWLLDNDAAVDVPAEHRAQS